MVCTCSTGFVGKGVCNLGRGELLYGGIADVADFIRAVTEQRLCMNKTV